MHKPGSARAGLMPRYFIMAHMPQGRAVFVFGEFLEQPSVRVDSWVPAITYSVEDPEGTETRVNASTTWAINDVFFGKARMVAWNMSDPSAPIEELDATMRQLRRLKNTPANRD